MVVIVIIGILIGISVPLIQPHLEDRSIREAAREINGFIALAKSRAAETGRPAGVYIERAASDPSTAFILQIVETHPPYSGDTTSAKARVHNIDRANRVADVDISFSPSLPALVNIGDRIRFDYRGAWYPIVTTPAGTTTVSFQISTPPDSSVTLPPPTTNGVSFQILRAPERAFGQNLELPARACIDLACSGINDNEFRGAISNPNSPVIIMFEPTGQVQSVYINYTSFAALGSIHLLVGRPENVTPGDPVGNASNLADQNAKWISINQGTGLVTTSDMIDVTGLANAANVRLPEARRLARESQISGGG